VKRHRLALILIIRYWSQSKDGELFMMERDSFNWMYPPIEPRKTGMLKVSGGHEIYWEESGNPQGKPVIFLHGGPGAGTSPKHRQFFNPNLYRIVMLDQRGSGKSNPFASIENNTTWDLVSDIESVRSMLGIEKWQVFGGSWGSTLALAYSQKHPDRVTELVLRGIFLLRKKEIQWFYQFGASEIFPDAWESYLAPIPMEERSDLVSAYHRRLTSSDSRVRSEAAKAWSIWEGATSKLFPDAAMVAHYGSDDFSDAFARIECHYFVNRGFLSVDDQLLRDVEKIRHIPAVIVQGRYDVVCPMDSAWALHRAWPEAELMVVPDAGHSAFENNISRALVSATDRFAVQVR
jgi:proline iminopeptidase